MPPPKAVKGKAAAAPTPVKNGKVAESIAAKAVYEKAEIVAVKKAVTPAAAPAPAATTAATPASSKKEKKTEKKKAEPEPESESEQEEEEVESSEVDSEEERYFQRMQDRGMKRSRSAAMSVPVPKKRSIKNLRAIMQVCTLFIIFYFLKCFTYDLYLFYCD